MPLIASWTRLLSFAWALSQSLSWMLFDANAIFDRNATSGAHMSNWTVSLSTALIWLNCPEYVAEFAPTVYFGRFAQSTAVSGYDFAANAAAEPPELALAAGWLAGAFDVVDDGVTLGVEPAQALKTITALPMTARGDHLAERDMHSSSNGSVTGHVAFGSRSERPIRARSAHRPQVAGARKPSTGCLRRCHGSALAERYARRGSLSSFSRSREG